MEAGMNIGYAPVSTDDQKVNLQLDALTKAGCTKIFQDEVRSGAQVERPGHTEALAALTQGDMLVVWRLDRLGRSMPHLVSVVHALGERGVGFQPLTEAINTTTAGGKLMFQSSHAYCLCAAKSCATQACCSGSRGGGGTG
jgi:DNA invertase Pin-like site-specific DNA recombinase